ncbi:MAG TPA: Flp pilus assembly protein CpaB [Ramlibacter sp.]|uniref:Flp pilus assembly protein CpaB n=1 Tax=Ramlibacter sp. TaxID=1917967 RepID=UPI002D80563F|nr:Flp pilus assembly protein CpaB [Ramlibacter sp.]HET8746394.1 Flp pilus assembly protein CpaB [Ramlibacter sp.]
MKNARPWLIILTSVVVGAAAVVLAARWVAQQASVATQKVVVAVRDLDVGTRLRPDMLQVVDWPSGAPLKEPYAETDKVVDRVLNTQVLRGEPIVASRLAAPGEKGGLSAVLEEGRRAITVKVNEIVGVAGFALPGNYVDVMVNTADDANKAVSKIVLERILVLAVAQDTSQAGEAKPRVVSAVTLEVTPEQAEKIDLARSVGSLSLVLRSQADKGSAATVGARKMDLFGPAEKIPPQPVAAAKVEPPAAAPSAAPARPRVVTAARKPTPAARRAQQAAAISGAAAAPGAAAPAPKRASVEVIRGMKRTVEEPEESPL